MSIESMVPSNHLIFCHPLLLPPSLFPSIREMSQFFSLGDQSIGVSASASVLPMNTQDWSPLGWTGWISLQSKGLSGVFSSIAVQKHHGVAKSWTQLSDWTELNAHVLVYCTLPDNILQLASTPNTFCVFSWRWSLKWWFGSFKRVT